MDELNLPSVNGNAVRVTAGETSVIVSSPDPGIIDWITGYVTPWWHIASANAADGPLVVATVSGVDEVAAEVAAGAWEEVGYPRATTRYARKEDDTVIAVTPGERVAYRYTPSLHRMDVHGHESLTLARASVRVARELVRAQMVGAGWTLLHASAAVMPDGRAVLTLGGRGAGKSTVAFTLASRGAGLLGNDRVFARVHRDGGVELAPWPSGAAVGLGLLGALGWMDIARQRLANGAGPHPSQDPRVTAALLAGTTTALREGTRELKAHIRPEEFFSWYGLTGASSGRVAAVLFPAFHSDAEPKIEPGRTAAVADADFVMGAQEDSYPDIFGLTGGLGAGSAHARAAVAAELDKLPGYAVVLSHDHGANAVLLTSVAQGADADVPTVRG
ncbi:hypothetical protein ACFHYQ_13585 [Sphaerimonospora cavernae]|uniref:Uncharacterized protein n=1 Tax=Sphaerimonospora cavernae TaxID=1740611 RepID=A0ABV6U4G7_9ACTN